MAHDTAKDTSGRLSRHNGSSSSSGEEAFTLIRREILLENFCTINNQFQASGFLIPQMD